MRVNVLLLTVFYCFVRKWSSHLQYWYQCILLVLLRLRLFFTFSL